MPLRSPTYDAGDRLTQIADSSNGTISRAYDGLDRVTSETAPEGTVTYTYDAAGRRSSMTVPTQTVINYGYDNANRLTSITQGSSVVSFTYDNANRRSTLNYPNGITATYGYDNTNQLASLSYAIAQTTLGTLTYTYDLAGNRTKVDGSWARTGLPQALTSATYDAANRIATWNGGAYGYDRSGNLVSDGTNTYTWNPRNQLAATAGAENSTYAYDAFGRRRSKTINGTTTRFLYDRRNFVQELSSGGTPTANLLTGFRLDETFTRTDASGTSSILADALGSTLALADPAGSVQTQYTFDPFGATTVSGGASSNSQQFTGRENDSNGNYYFRGRYQRPSIHRFVSEDPLSFRAGDVNLHSYVGNNPTLLKDPLGTQIVLAAPFPEIWVPLVGGYLGWKLGNWIWDNWVDKWIDNWTAAQSVPTWPTTYPSPGAVPPTWRPHPSGKPGTWIDADGWTWHWHDVDQGHPTAHWDIGGPRVGDKPGEQWKWEPGKPPEKKSKSDDPDPPGM